MIDPELIEDLRRLVNTLRSVPEWQRDLERAVPTDLVRQLAEDFRSYNPAPRSLTPPATVTVVGSGKVVTGDVGPQHRPIDTEATTDRSGWREAPKIDNWRAPGLEHMDRMMDAQDAIDRVQRVRELGEAATVQRALKQSVEPKEQEPKAPKDRGDRK
jgi:hypothetical protein